jgi:hypothetical protein
MADAKDPVPKNIQAQRQSLYPTPPIGTIVIWYEKGVLGEGRGEPAVVRKADGPGRLSLALLCRSRGAVKANVQFKEMPNATNANSRGTHDHGCWGYVEGTAPANEDHAHYRLHSEHLAKREENYVQSQGKRK